jgi:Asp/Glu/hydantoin racemase
VRFFEEAAAERSLAGRLASVRTLGGRKVDVARAAEELAEPLLALAERCVEDDGADALIFGGGPLAGLARRLADRLPVPALDPTACAVRMAELLVGLAPRKAAQGSFAAPGPKSTQGLSPALRRVFER